MVGIYGVKMWCGDMYYISTLRKKKCEEASWTTGNYLTWGVPVSVGK